MMGSSVCGMVAVTLLLLASGRPTEACSCAPVHPQTVFCHSDVVVRGRIVGEKVVERDHSTAQTPSWQRYEIKVNKVFKGSDEMQNLEFMYTPVEESLCGYKPSRINRTEDFLFTGNIVENKMMITLCGWNTPWIKLTPGQRRGLSQVYKTGCKCVIIPCHGPCAVENPDECLWTDALTSNTWYAHQVRNEACVQTSNDTCLWQSLKSRVGAITIFKSRT